MNGTQVVFAADSNHLVTVNGSHTPQGIQVRRVEDGKQMATVAVGDVGCLAVSQDGRWIAVGTGWGKLIVWDAKTYTEFFTEACGVANDIDFSPGSTRVVVALGSSNGLIYGHRDTPHSRTATVWNIQTRRIVGRPLCDVGSDVYAAKYSSQGDRIVTATAGSVRVYDSGNSRLLVNIPVKVALWYNTGLLWLNDQLLLALEGKIRKFGSRTGVALSEWPVPNTDMHSRITLLQYGGFIACSSKCTITFWDSSTHIQLALIKHTQDIDSIALSPDAQFLAIGEKDGKVAIKHLSHIAESNPLFRLHCTLHIPRMKLDALDITGQQRLCEALYEAGRTTDAGKSLLIMVNSFDEELYASESIIDWVSDFVQRCLPSPSSESKTDVASTAVLLDVKHRHCEKLEKFGDTAVDAQQYDVAISRYSAALSLNPAVRRGTFIKRSKARMATGLWEDALNDIDQVVTLDPSTPWRYQSLSIQGAEAISMDGSWTDALLSVVDFMAPRLMIYRAICEYLLTIDHILDARGCLHQMSNELAGKIDMDHEDEHEQWIFEFKLRCSKRLEHFGDVAVDAQRHDEAISQYSAAISFDSDSSQGLLIKRGKARMTKELWADALSDANAAIALDLSSPWGYGTKHTSLRGSGDYVDAIDTFQMMLSEMAQSPDPTTRERCDYYISLSRGRSLVRKVVQQTTRRLPRVLINTTTGRLYNKSEQASAFESLPLFNGLASSLMTTSIARGRIKREVQQFFRYVVLSHKWEENEPLFQQVVHTAVYDLDKSPTHEKLQTFCKIARDAGFNWAWCDTCCINKQDHFILQEALVAMFKWYRGSAMMIVFLRGVHSPAKLGDLVRSVWNTRAWTFQEYVAARVIQFYTEDWTLYLDPEIQNHKESPEIISEMEQVTGVSAQQLRSLRPGLNSIREKLHLASTRQTTLVEDVAYSLLGIFSVTGMPAIYGEGESALGRLLAHILPGSGDVSILAWNGQSSGYNSCLPAHITVYSQPASSHLPPPIGDTEMVRIVTRLRMSAIDLDSALELYDRLNELPEPWFAGTRMKLPCITFKLPLLSSYQANSPCVYRVETPIFGTVQIKTRQDLSRMKSLYLVHPWLDSLLDREDMEGSAFVGDDAAEPSSPNVDDEDLSEEEVEEDFAETSSLNTHSKDTEDEETDDNASPLPEPKSPSPSTSVSMNAVPMSRETRALRLISRLRQPFGALLFTRTSAGQRAVVYKRVAADCLITVQMQEMAPLDEVLGNVRILDVL